MSPFHEGLAFEAGGEFSSAMAALATQEGALSAKAAAAGFIGGAAALAAAVIPLVGMYWGANIMLNKGLRGR